MASDFARTLAWRYTVVAWAFLSFLFLASALAIVLGDAYLRNFGGRARAYAVRRDEAPTGQLTTIYEIVVDGAPHRFRLSDLHEERPLFDYLPTFPALARPRGSEPVDYWWAFCAGLLGFGATMAGREAWRDGPRRP